MPVLALIATLLSGIAAPGEQTSKKELPPGWKSQTSKPGGFSVALPPGAVAVNEKQTFKDLSERHIQGLAGFVDNKTVFIAYSFALPDELLKLAPSDQLLALGKAFKKELGDAVPQRETKVMSGTLAGLEIEAGDKQGNGIVRLFVARQRVYVLMAAGQKLAATSAGVQAFFDSFEIHGQ